MYIQSLRDCVKHNFWGYRCSLTFLRSISLPSSVSQNLLTGKRSRNKFQRISCSWTEKFSENWERSVPSETLKKGPYEFCWLQLWFIHFKRASHHLVRNKIISLQEYSELSGSLSVYLYKWLKNCDPRKTRVNMEQRLESFLNLSSYYEIFNFR